MAIEETARSGFPISGEAANEMFARLDRRAEERHDKQMKLLRQIAEASGVKIDAYEKPDGEDH